MGLEFGRGLGVWGLGPFGSPLQTPPWSSKGSKLLFRVERLGFRVRGFRFRVWGLGFGD